RIHRRQLRNPGAGRLWRGAGGRHRIRRPRLVMRQQRREHDERQRVGILIAVEHVPDQRAFGLVHAGGKQGVGGEAGPVRQRDRLPDGFSMQWSVAEIERTNGGPRPFQRARHGREVAPDQVDHAGAENFPNVGVDVGDFTSRFGFENRRNALSHRTYPIVGAQRRTSRRAHRLSKSLRGMVGTRRFALPTIHLNVASTVPNPSSSILTLSPALSHTVFTRLPVSTICPACNPLPSSARWLASQASALWGWPSTSAPVPLPASLPLTIARPLTVSRSGALVRVTALPSTQPAAKKSSATSVGAPIVSHLTYRSSTISIAG